MIENRKYYEVIQGNGDILHKVVMKSQLCNPNTEESRHIKNVIFNQLASNLALTYCGPMEFETLTFKHDGTRWLITAVAIEKKLET